MGEDTRTPDAEYEGATDEWYARRGGHPDRPSVSVWFPTSLPLVRLDTYFDGQNEHLPSSGPITAHIVIGGVDIGGPLDDLELLWKAVQEQLIAIRRCADRLADQDAPTGPGGGR